MSQTYVKANKLSGDPRVGAKRCPRNVKHQRRDGARNYNKRMPKNGQATGNGHRCRRHLAHSSSTRGRESPL